MVVFFCVFMGCFLSSMSQAHLLEAPFKDTSHIELESTIMTSFYLNSLFKDPLFECSHILQRVKPLVYSIWENTTQPVIPPKDSSCSHRAHPPSAPTSKLPLFCFRHYRFVCICILLHKRNLAVCSHFCLLSFTQHISLDIHSCGLV